MALKAGQVYQSNNLQDQSQAKTQMLQIESLTSTLSYSAITSDRKIHSSIGTEATNDDAFKKKISLCSCSSSISLSQNLEHTKEKEVFARYLFSENASKSQKIFLEMREIFSSLHLDEPKGERQYLVDVSTSEADLEGKVFTYFIDVWLRYMGYGSKKNRSSLLGKAKLFLGYQALKPFNKLYHNLNLIPLSKLQKRRFLIQTCRNGWEYFVQELNKLSCYQQTKQDFIPLCCCFGAQSNFDSKPVVHLSLSLADTQKINYGIFCRGY